MSKLRNNKSITVYDIAKEAEVSPATVSRVLTNSANVSDEKKTRVEKIIAKYDFEPNWIARSLSKKVTNTIGMIVPDIRNPFYSNLFIECENVAARYGYHIILCNSLSNNEVEEEQLRNLVEKRVESIILVGGNIDEVYPSTDFIQTIKKIAKRIPIIIAGELEGVDKNIYHIMSNKNHGMEDIINYLIENGHRDIAILGGRDSVIPTIRKRTSMIELLNNKGIVANNDYIIDCEYTIEGGYNAAMHLLQMDKLPSAVIAINDICAMGIVRAFHEQNIQIPDDISIVSYDDSFLADISKPALTSMSYNLREYSECIMNTIKQITSGIKVDSYQYINTSLHIRNSCDIIYTDAT